MKKQTNKLKPVKKVKTSSVKKAIKKQKVSKAVQTHKYNPMKTLKNDSPKDETKETVPHVVINKDEPSIVDSPLSIAEGTETTPVDNSTVEVDHDFLVNNELTGIYDGENTLTKEDGTRCKTVPGLVPYAVAGAVEGMLLQVIYTGKDANGNFKFVVNELEVGDPGYFSMK